MILCELYNSPPPPPLCIRPQACIFIDFCHVSTNKKMTGKQPTNYFQTPTMALPPPLSGKGKKKKGNNVFQFLITWKKLKKKYAKGKKANATLFKYAGGEQGMLIPDQSLKREAPKKMAPIDL